MARSARPINTGQLPGLLALAIVLALSLGCLGAVLALSGGPGQITAPDWQALRFTLLQATLSAFLSVALAVPVARALARRRFFGRRILITGLGAPFILPVLVAAMGLLTIFGRSGLVNRVLAALGLPVFDVYGLGGILLAHLFLNLPLAVRMILNGWLAIPTERFRLAAALDLGPRDIARLIERPMLRAVLPGALLAIFLVCLSSFTVILMMGGGPAATTLELAIYQAFRMEFDLAHAASLAALQMALSLSAAVISLLLISPTVFGAGAGHAPVPWRTQGRLALVVDSLALGLCALFLAAPLASVVIEGVPQLPQLGPTVWMAAGRSILLAISASVLALLLSLSIAFLISDLSPRVGRIADSAAMLALAASPLVLGTGLFLILRPFADPVALALPLAAVLNAVMAMPFCLRILLPDVRTIRADYGRLAESLDLGRLAGLRLLFLPRLRRPLAFAGGLSAALAAGDLGAVALFADPARPTLPMQLYALAGSYRTGAAAGVSVFLMALSFLLFHLIDRLGHRDADT